MNRIIEWFRGSTAQNDLKVFFEKTTEECFTACVSAKGTALTPKEAECVEACTRKRVALLRAIEEAMESKLRQS